MDRIDLFKIFVRVVECSSFTRAASTLDLPRSSVSTAVKDLEDHVGARLLHRTTRQVSPTQDGIAFYERCVQLIADTEEVECLFRQADAKLSGKLRIDVPSRIGRLVLAPALPDFLLAHPGVEIELGVTDRAVNLIEDRLDCVLRVGPLADSSLVARSIGELPLVNVASPAYLEQYGVPQTPDNLDAHWAVNYASPSNDRVEAWEWREHGALRTTHVRAHVTVNNAEASLACCLAGLGLIQIPAYDARHHLDSGELVEVMPGFRADPLPMTLLYPHRQHLSRRLHVFMQWLEGLLKEHIL